MSNRVTYVNINYDEDYITFRSGRDGIFEDDFTLKLEPAFIMEFITDIVNALETSKSLLSKYYNYYKVDIIPNKDKSMSIDITYEHSWNKIHIGLFKYDKYILNTSLIQGFRRIQSEFDNLMVSYGYSE